jgi:hypothetical protein
LVATGKAGIKGFLDAFAAKPPSEQKEQKGALLALSHWIHEIFQALCKEGTCQVVFSTNVVMRGCCSLRVVNLMKKCPGKKLWHPMAFGSSPKNKPKDVSRH